MNISNLSDAELKIFIIRMLKEVNEDFNSIKKIQSEVKATLIEIKNNLQANNSGVDEAEKSIIWNIRKQKQPNRTTTTKESKKCSISCF